ncbi:MAG: undecaprenyl-diphosphate phosphatase [Haloarculaceae archaeon]
MDEPLLGLLVGVIQGIVEWLPVSSEGTVSIVLTGLDVAADEATSFALVLHGGTAIAATVYYRDVLRDLLRRVPGWRPTSAFDAASSDLSFYALATLASGITGVAGYLVLEEVTTALAGGAFLALIGALLLVTGVVLWVGEREAGTHDDDSAGVGGPGTAVVTARSEPTATDAVLVGLLQGVAVLPGISRSGTTVSALLLRGYEGPAALQFSFVLSIPAAFGAGLVAYVQSGLPGISPLSAGLALLASAVVGYATVDGLTRLASRLAFSRICIGFGALAVAGGVLVIV